MKRLNDSGMLSSASATSSSNRSGETSTMPVTVGRSVSSVDADRLLDGLDGDQREAVTTPGAPLAILAPAGSGKTRVLTRRIAYRVATGTADPGHVLAITFTRRAAGELLRRLDQLGLRQQPTVGTFHGVAWSVLRRRWADQDVRRPPELLPQPERLLAEVARPGNPGRPRRGGAAGP